MWTRRAMWHFLDQTDVYKNKTLGPQNMNNSKNWDKQPFLRTQRNEHCDRNLKFSVMISLSMMHRPAGLYKVWWQNVTEFRWYERWTNILRGPKPWDLHSVNSIPDSSRVASLHQCMAGDALQAYQVWSEHVQQLENKGQAVALGESCHPVALTVTNKNLQDAIWWQHTRLPSLVAILF